MMWCKYCGNHGCDDCMEDGTMFNNKTLSSFGGWSEERKKAHSKKMKQKK